jgi:hypothetical protein
MTKAPRIYKLALCYFVILQIVIGTAIEAFAAAVRDPGNHGNVQQLRRRDKSRKKEPFNPPPVVRANVNEVTDFFDRNIQDKRDIEAEIQKSLQSAHEGILSSTSNAEVPNIDKANQESARLSSVPEYELDTAGMRARQSEQYSFYDENGFEIDRSQPLVLAHKRDMDEIAKETEVLFSNFAQALKKEGIEVDCKTALGKKEQEPEYYITQENEPKLDTVYDKFFCEQPHHTYSCNYVLTTVCAKPSMRWSPWQPKQIRVSGGELVNSGQQVFNIYKPRDKVFEYGLSLQNHYQIRAMKAFLLTKHPEAQVIASRHPEAGLDNISDDMSGWPEGGTFSIDGWYYGGRRLGSKDYAFDTYVVNYQYRDGQPICLQWQDTWREQCRVD